MFFMGQALANGLVICTKCSTGALGKKIPHPKLAKDGDN